MRIRFCALRATLIGVTVVALASVTSTAAAQTVELDDQTTMRFATVDEARELLGAADDWVRAFGPFDLQLRTQSTEPVTQKAFLEFASDNARDWDGDEIEQVTRVIAALRSKITALSLALELPDEVLLVQTTGDEEGNAGGYTRGEAIVIPESMLKSADEQFERFMLHELFHVMTRHSPEIRIPLYALVGFEYCGEIEYPEELIPLKITNPDAFHFDACVQVTAKDRSLFAIPLTLSKSESYGGGGMFSYVTIQFVEVEMNSGRASVKYVDGKPVLFAMADVEGYMQKIGANTGYIIHPEEIMADNFVIAIQQKQDVPHPEIPAGILKVLSGKD